MILPPSLALPTRLAWRQLRSERARLISAIAGVMFACVLVFMQLGFRGALFDSATKLPQAMQGELFLVHPLTNAFFRPEPLPRVRAYQTLAVPEVEVAAPVYLAQAAWRHPITGERRAIQLVGFDTESGAMSFPGLKALIPALKRPDTIAFDSLSRPEFGPVAALLAERGSLKAEIANREVEVVGTIELGASFGADGNAVMNELNFRRLIKDRVPSKTDLVALRLRPGSDPQAVKARLTALLPNDVRVVTHAELVQWERDYWQTRTPIGFIFAFGSLMGLVVGMVIVYQILFADIASHLSEYATLKAMGYSAGYLARVVLAAAAILAVAGYVPGVLACVGLYDVVATATRLPMQMELARAVVVFALIFGMCVTAGLLAMRKLRDADPADMF